MKNLKKQIKLLLVFAQLGLVVLVLMASNIFCSTVSGKIINVVGLPIPNAEIVFESEFELHKTRTNSSGLYSLELSSTTYSVSTGAWVGRLAYPKDEPFYDKKCLSYFRESHRANFHLTLGQSLEINFVIPEAECISADDDTVENVGSYGMFANPSDMAREPRTRYETLYFPKDEFRSGLDLVIRFGERKNVNGTVTYGPSSGYRLFTDKSLRYVFGHPFPGVVITYNNFTYYMLEAKFDSKSGRLEATKGKIIAEDGSKQYTLKQLVIKIRDKKIEIKSS